MSVLDRIAYFQGRRDEEPNTQLGQDLAEARDHSAIREIAAGLKHPEPRVRSDCIKVLYEIGNIEPGLISEYTESFLNALASKNKRLVWGGMTALSTVAHLRAELLCQHYDEIVAAIDSGSVITRDRGIRVLAAIAEQGSACRQQALEYLLGHLANCRPKDVPQHASSALRAIGPDQCDRFVATLRARLPELSSTQARRTQIVIKKARRRADEG